MKKILLCAFIIFAAYCPLNAFSQVLTEANLPDKGPVKKTDPIETPKNSNDLVNFLLGTNKTTSLMFDEEEINDIERAVESFKNDQTYVPGQDSNGIDAKKGKKPGEENKKSYIFLASIMYYSPQDWAVWINNSKVTSESNSRNKELFVKEIYPDRAKIVWSLTVSKWRALSGTKDEQTPKVNADNNVEIEFVLKPNQTFNLISRNVVEGRAVANIAKEKVAGKETAKTIK